MKQPYVRQALISGINRQQIANTLYATIAPGLPALESLIFKPFEKTYQKNFAVWKFNQQKVIDILQKKGCTGGPSKPSASNQSIFSCPNVASCPSVSAPRPVTSSAGSPSRSCRGSSRASESSSSLASR